MPGRITRSLKSREDLAGIGLYIAQFNPAAADRVLEKIDERLQLLSDFPRSGTKRPDLAENLRCVAEGNYVIFFRPIEDGIELVRVIHGARDYEAMFREEQE